MKGMSWTAMTTALILLPLTLSALPLSRTADELGSAARRKGISRVAVLPLDARGAAGSQDGKSLAEKLVAQLVRQGKVRVMERTRLDEVMSERHLAQAGAMGTAVLPQAGAAAGLQAAEAVVTGAFSRRGGNIHLVTRLVDAGSGEVLAAAEEDLPWETAPDSGLGDPGTWTLVVPPPEFLAEVPSLDGMDIQMRDAPRDEDCSSAPDRVDLIESGILELKARYWAGKLREGVSPYSLTHNPGSTITDSTLKKRFYDTMKAQYDRPAVQPLSPRELERFQREDARALNLYRQCGL